ncbi:MAG: 30S ribosomal protein S21 [Pseudomonas sp.]|uniref:30S ribosomal protein S21 n=1 Tax=Pseudomonas sp. TaxID=306 RepID=UPI003D0D0B6E
MNEGESVELALRTLSRKVGSEMGRRWYKRRFGFHEKPSVLKRKRSKMKKLAIQSGGGLWLRIGLEAQFSRTENSAAGR